MRQEETRIAVFSSRAAALIETFERDLPANHGITFRALSPTLEAYARLPAGTPVVIDFTSLGDTLARHRARELARNYRCLSLMADADLRCNGAEGFRGEVMAWPGAGEELWTRLQRLSRQPASTTTLEQQLTLRFNLVGESPVFRQALEQVRKFACCDAPVMVLGETGTGKEKIARAIHYLGVDEGMPFVAVNCGALPDSLVENELFGHVKGAYTDAREARRGLVEQAAGGTLFLDEIETLSGKGQVALLRFLQEYEYRPIGAERVRTAHLRLITASNECLEELVRQGRFRKDLYYRINILSLTLPALRDRGDDVLLLADHFLERYRARYDQPARTLSAATRQWLRRFDWPGNVRELENLLLRGFLLAEGDEIHFDPPAGAGRERRGETIDRRFHQLYRHSFQEAKRLVVERFERTYLQQMLRETQGNVSRAARKAGKERRAFTKLLEKHGLHRSQFR